MESPLKGFFLASLKQQVTWPWSGKILQRVKTQVEQGTGSLRTGTCGTQKAGDDHAFLLSNGSPFIGLQGILSRGEIKSFSSPGWAYVKEIQGASWLSNGSFEGKAKKTSPRNPASFRLSSTSDQRAILACVYPGNGLSFLHNFPHIDLVTKDLGPSRQAIVGGGCAGGQSGLDFRSGNKSGGPKLKVPIPGTRGCTGNMGPVVTVMVWKI